MAVDAGAAHQHVDAAQILPHLGHGVADQQRLELQARILGRQADQAQALLIQHEVQRRRQQAPVEMGVDHALVLRHDRARLFGNGADRVDIRPKDAEQHGITDRRPEDELRNPHTRLGEAAFGDQAAHLHLEGIAFLGILGEDDDLRIGGIGQHGIERQDEARRAGADVAGHDLGFVLRPQHRFKALDLLLGCREGAARRHVDLDRQFRPIGVRKKLLGHRAHADHRRDEDGDRQARRDPFVIDAGAHHHAQALIVLRRVDRVVAAHHRLDVRQDFHPDVGDEIDGDEPRGEQRKGDDPKDVAGIFAGGGAGEADGQKARDRHQRARQHREGGGAPRVGRGGDAIDAFLHLHHHHLDRDDGVVDEQAERDDQRAERDAIEVAPRGHHDDEDGGERQRHGRGDDDADAQAECDEADDDHHRQSGEELRHEFADGLGNHLGLVRDLGEGHAERQFGAEFGIRRLQRFAERQPVEARLHDDAQHQRAFALVADGKRRGIDVAAMHLGDVADLQRTPAGIDRDILDRIDIVDPAIDAEIDARALGFDEAGRRDVVLAAQGVEQILGGDAECRQPLIGDLDKNLLRLLAQDIDLEHAGDAQQLLTNVFGLQDELAMR